MALFFADENFPGPVVLLLRAYGHDVITIQEIGLGGVGTPDPVVVATATRLSRAVLTLNRRHFFALHAADPHHAGIVACKDAQGDVVGLADRIDAAVSTLPYLAGQLVRVTRPNPPASS